MTNTDDVRKQALIIECKQDHDGEFTYLSSIRERRGRPPGTIKRQISEGVSHARLNTIRAAILKMDRTNPRIWSLHGHPKTAYLQEITGISDIAQWEISRSCPGLSRANAAKFTLDMSNLTLHQGGWRFQMLRGPEYIRRNLGTADLELARKIRDWFCVTGNWDYPEHFLLSGET